MKQFEGYPTPTDMAFDNPAVAVANLRLKGGRLIALSQNRTFAWFGPYYDLPGSDAYSPLFDTMGTCGEFGDYLVGELGAELVKDKLYPNSGITRENIGGGFVESLTGLSGGMRRNIPTGVNSRGVPTFRVANLEPVIHRIQLLRSCLTK